MVSVDPAIQWRGWSCWRVEVFREGERVDDPFQAREQAAKRTRLKQLNTAPHNRKLPEGRGDAELRLLVRQDLGGTAAARSRHDLGTR